MHNGNLLFNSSILLEYFIEMNKVFNFLFIVVMILLSSIIIITIVAIIPLLILTTADGLIKGK